MGKRNEKAVSGAARQSGRKPGAKVLWREVVVLTSFAAHSFFELAIKRCRPH